MVATIFVRRMARKVSRAGVERAVRQRRVPTQPRPR